MVKSLLRKHFRENAEKVLSKKSILDIDDQGLCMLSDNKYLGGIVLLHEVGTTSYY